MSHLFVSQIYSNINRIHFFYNCNCIGSGTWPSTWLLLKNMTAQIDGSTLRTLCMQHGPLQQFQLYLNHGIALCKYSSREEANKAQMALNNCVLGNTTICAESPCESEVQSILQHLGVPNQQQPPTQQQPQVILRFFFHFIFREI